MRILPLSLFAACFALACGSNPSTSSTEDTGGSLDGTSDSTSEETSVTDTGSGDGATTDGAPGDDAATTDTGATDTGATDTGATDTGSTKDTALFDGSTACNALENVGDTVIANRVAEAYPTLKGGTLADGTYVVTAVTEYTGPGGATGPDPTATMKQTVRFTAGKFEIVRSQNAEPDQRYAGTFTTAAAKLTLSNACPTPGTLPFDFETSGSSVKIGLGSFANQVITYTKK